MMITVYEGERESVRERHTGRVDIYQHMALVICLSLIIRPPWSQSYSGVYGGREAINITGADSWWAVTSCS